jgi:hypothetical protein
VVFVSLVVVGLFRGGSQRAGAGGAV